MRRLGSHPAWVAVMLLAAASLFMSWANPPTARAGGPASTPQAKSAKAPNPHFKPDACGSYHAIAGGKPLPIAAQKVDTLCLSCHDGIRASEEAHPVGVPVTGMNA